MMSIKKIPFRILSLLLISVLTLSCIPGRAHALGILDWLFSDDAQTESAFTVTPFSEMTYTRPDLEEMQALVEEACLLAQGQDADAMLDKLFEFYDAYDWFYTEYSIANIYYSADLTDSDWEEENGFCSSASSQVEQMLSEIYAAFAASPAREDLEWAYFGDEFLDDYESEGEWSADETLVALMNRESELINQYYTQSAETDSLLGSLFPPYEDMAQTLVDLILVRNELADYLGYDSYEAYTSSAYYARDYTPEQVEQYLAEVQEKLVPLYVRTSYNSAAYQKCTETQVYAYVRSAAEAIGGTVQEAFQLMDEGGLYDISKSSKKYDSSFEVYLTSYGEPYILMNPEGTALDQLTFAHEFGHFCNDYAMGGAYSSIDVSEIFSQAMEYLSLLYAPAEGALADVKMADSLFTQVEQACYARFEQEIYQIPEDELSVQALEELYTQVCADYGLDQVGLFDSMGFVTIPHFYSNPMYVASYVFSNDAAMQIYQLELEESGAGLSCYLENLDNEQTSLLAFLESAGLESPFAEGRMDALLETYTQALTLDDAA